VLLPAQILALAAFALMAAAVVALNIWNGKRRSIMTAEERGTDDDDCRDNLREW
jgi:hypothetical protein